MKKSIPSKNIDKKRNNAMLSVLML